MDVYPKGDIEISRTFSDAEDCFSRALELHPDADAFDFYVDKWGNIKCYYVEGEAYDGLAEYAGVHACLRVLGKSLHILHVRLRLRSIQHAIRDHVQIMPIYESERSVRFLLTPSPLPKANAKLAFTVNCA